ncbi:DeoR/GlpR family DNA-binding transcription regulator [Blautia schinkii]|nr:DeoR/GlpR family DNA-binding transcription regulator [Blautia schinkii]
MLAIDRRKTIKELLQEQKSVSITDLASRLNVAKETIRRDLRAMEKDNELIRTHGGAYILEGVHNDLDITTRQVLKTTEKETIARKCDALIQTGDFIYLDSSTTAWFIARKISQRKLTVVTTSLEIANILSTSPTIRLFLIGGEFSRKTMSFEGDGAVRNLEQYFIDKAFISCRSVSMQYGVTDTSDNAALLHKIALAHAKQKFLVIDHSKLDNISFSRVVPLDMLDGIIMDMDFSPEWKICLDHNNVRYY